MTLSIALPSQFNSIRDIAQRTWPDAYSEIITTAQLDYMLEMMYSIEALERNLAAGHQFVLAQEDGKYLGFTAYEHGYKGENRTHIHKIYVLPEAQGKSVGRRLMQFVQKSAAENGSGKVTLNVNRKNKAQFFYRKLGFDIAETVDIEIGEGYLMEDYVMQLTIDN
jgi:ribosomal protein S18 acetylase RimI-like enzyme